MKAYKQIKKKQTNKSNKHCGSESNILNWARTGHTGSRWYTSDLRVLVIDIEVFVPRCQQGLFPDLVLYP